MGKLAGRGQSGVELIVGLVFIVMIFLVIVLLSMEKTSESADIKTYLDVKRLGGSVKDNINMISQQGPGYYSYFSIPEQLQGGYEYDLFMRGNVMELMWGNNTWSAKLLASNATVHCLSKGLNRKNRIFYSEDGIEITCHLPNLKIPKNRVIVNKDGNYTKAYIVNDAHVDSPGFTATFRTRDNETNVSMSGLPAGESVMLQFNSTLADYVTVYADSGYEVNESIEDDNNYTAII
ncbi:MAG: CARDB domain-containing protein [Candidatus Altiarchaeota archaeon]